MRHQRHTRKGKHHNRARRIKTRRTRRRRQRGGVYAAGLLKGILKETENYGESQNMFGNMTKPCIHPDYPRFTEITVPGQNDDMLTFNKYMILISEFQKSGHDEQHKKRDMILIIVSGDVDGFISADILLFKKESDLSTPAALLEAINEDFRTVELIDFVRNSSTRATFEPIYHALLSALEQLYTQKNEEGEEEGVHEC
jgi:hypothetical protein